MNQLDLELTGLAAGGDAVGRDPSGRVTFVSGGAPGERVRVNVLEERRSFARGEVAEVLRASPARVTPPCPLAAARTCGGCPWMHLDEPAQLTARHELAASALRKSGLALLPPVAAAPPLGWRRRARFRWSRERGATVATIGLHAPRSHRVTDVATCPQLEPALDAALTEVRAILGLHLHGHGELHLAVGHTGDVHVVIDPSDGGVIADGAAARLLGRARITGVVITPDARSRRVDGVATIELEPGLEVAADGFAQASAAGNAALVAAVLAEVAPTPGLRVLELFAGAGNFTRHLAAAGAHVTANDLVAPPARPDVSVIAGPAEAAVARLAGETFDVVLLDPPRTGARDAVRALAGLTASRLVYVSCDPATLARDLELAVEAGWRPLHVRVIDLMPQTAHVELVAVLTQPSG